MLKKDEETDAAGNRRMTPKVLRKICVEKGGYATPELNDTVYFHYKGFSRIENLDAYVGVKALWLEGNGFFRIENLEPLQNLVCLFLQENLISRVENLDKNPTIRQLNLATNQIRTIGDGLCKLVNLETLNLSNNMLETVDDLRGLVEATDPDTNELVPVCQNLSVLDLSKNRIEDPAIVTILQRLPNLKVLNLMNNKIVRTMERYRKTIIHACPKLTYLDDRPVFDDERRAVTAYFAGGPEAEIAERRLCLAEKRAEESAQFVSMRAFLNGTLRDECIKIGNQERERYMKRFYETGEVDQYGGRNHVEEATVADPKYLYPVWSLEEVESVSKESLKSRIVVPIQLHSLATTLARPDDVPELEEVTFDESGNVITMPSTNEKAGSAEDITDISSDAGLGSEHDSEDVYYNRLPRNAIDPLPSKTLHSATEADTNNNDQFTSEDKLKQGPGEPMSTQEDELPVNKQEDKADGCDFSEPD
ncbi:Phosphatase 1 regulatory subunit, putative [Giardia lamblia P15]|uniref:Phosphatase 1 regulatory subunit, putative n=1 Tax=Giardia intestinalis (strain P15) TaxID=658858 RepID=E1F007_GIAIA|nr:Phosphatase 1 regulatory subunit, putative [Giardia lamblia P15]